VIFEEIQQMLERGWKRAKDIFVEAARRERAHYLEQGWTVDGDGNWSAPDGRQYFDGPGSHVSLFRFVEDVCRERGVDVSSVRSLFDTLCKG
jgi:hypothetical protein